MKVGQSSYSGQELKNRTAGVYALVHKSSGRAYVGSSTRCVLNRLSVHLSLLKNRRHSSKELQKLWCESSPEEWEFRLLEEGHPGENREREEYWMNKFHILNTFKGISETGFTHSEETKQKMRKSRAKYLSEPEARESLSQRAKIQHKNKRLGFHTRSDEAKAKAEENKLRKESRSLKNLSEDQIHELKSSAAFKANRETASGYRGVFLTPDGKFKAYLVHKHIPYELGVFTLAEEAARAYDKKSLELRGPKGFVNIKEE